MTETEFEINDLFFLEPDIPQLRELDYSYQDKSGVTTPNFYPTLSNENKFDIFCSELSKKINEEFKNHRLIPSYDSDVDFQITNFSPKEELSMPKKRTKKTNKYKEKAIERYRAKRSKRNWKKRILYRCRKNFADKRVRVQGRFVSNEIAEKIRAERG